MYAIYLILPFFFLLLSCLSILAEDHSFQKKRQLINSTELNRLLWSPIYVHPDKQLWVAYLILGYTQVYRSFQNIGKAFKQKDPLLLHIDIWVKRYILSPMEIARRNKGRRRSNSPTPFTLTHLRITVAIPIEHPRKRKRRRTSNPSSLSPHARTQELSVPTTLLEEGTSVEMSYQRTRVTFRQILATTYSSSPESTRSSSLSLNCSHRNTSYLGVHYPISRIARWVKTEEGGKGKFKARNDSP